MAVVLVVEDDLHVLFVTRSILRAEGHGTIAAASVEDARAVLDGDADIDAVVTDINLNGDTRGGLKVAEEIAEERPSVGIVYTTAGEIRGPLVEDSVLLLKPYTAHQLARAVEQVLADHNLQALNGSSWRPRG